MGKPRWRHNKLILNGHILGVVMVNFSNKCQIFKVGGHFKFLFKRAYYRGWADGRAHRNNYNCQKWKISFCCGHIKECTAILKNICAPSLASAKLEKQQTPN